MKTNIRWIRNRRGIILFCVFVIVSAFLIVSERNIIIKLRYENTDLELAKGSETTTNQELMIDITKYSSPEEIEALAKSYNLVNISPSQIVFMEDVDVDSEKSKSEEHQGFLAMLFKRNVSAIEK